MSIEKRAAHGVVWNIATGVGARIVGLVGTLILTRFIAPADYGQVSAAVICTQTAQQLSYFAVGQYIIANKSPPGIVFAAGVIHFVVGLLAMIGVYVLRGPLGDMLEAPEMGRYVIGFAVAIVIDRARHIPERLLVRDLKFRSVAIVNSLGELTFTATALALAPRWGGYAIMGGTLARSCVTFVAFVTRVPRSEWLVFKWPEEGIVRKLFGYGTPIMLGAMADRAASTWDNLLILRLFGARLMGCYALSYSLAETPLIYVAERMSDVLMPAFSKMEPAERPATVVRSAGLMSLVVAPLGVGLGAVAPTVVHAFFDSRWAEMGAILSALSVGTIFQPAAWPAIAYLQTEKLTRTIMIVSAIRAVVLLSAVATLGWLGGPVWACIGVGIGFLAHSLVTVYATGVVTQLSARSYLFSTFRPLLACVPMFFAVRATGFAFARLQAPAALELVVEIAVGAIVYLLSAFILARKNVDELLGLVRTNRAAKG